MEALLVNKERNAELRFVSLCSLLLFSFDWGFYFGLLSTCFQNSFLFPSFLLWSMLSGSQFQSSIFMRCNEVRRGCFLHTVHVRVSVFGILAVDPGI